MTRSQPCGTTLIRPLTAYLNMNNPNQCEVCGGLLQTDDEKRTRVHPSCGPQYNGQEVIAWPTADGLWMAYIEAMGCWFPLRAMALRDDLDSKNPNPPVLAIVAQFPESETSWPFTFRQCHPAKRWRRPTDEEKEKAMKFYGIKDLQAANEEVRAKYPLPRCKHGQAMRDHGGELLRPTCGCKLEDYILDAVFAPIQ